MIEFILSAPFILSAIFILFVSIAILLEFEKSGWATTLFSFGLALSIWAYKTEIWDAISTNPLSTFCFIIGYITTGLIWSLFKWKLYILKRINLIDEQKYKFEKNNGKVKENWQKWIDFLNSNVPSYLRSNYFGVQDSPESIGKSMIPVARDKKSLIVSWISYWPMSMGATLLNNPFKRFFEWIYGMVSGIYDKMGSSAADKIASGLEKEETPQKPKKEIING